MANFILVLWFPMLAWLDLLSSSGYRIPNTDKTRSTDVNQSH